jgi:hypothetical protein
MIMWLDALKPKTGNIQKNGVPGDPGVPPPREPNEYVGMAITTDRNTEKNQGVPSVPACIIGTPGTQRNTVTKTECTHDTPPHKSNEYAGLFISGTPGTPGTPKKHHKPEVTAGTNNTWELFRLDLVRAEIEAGYPASELHRVNNMAYEFMQADDMGFNDAIKLAAEIIVCGQITACEAAYADVVKLFKKIR